MRYVCHIEITVRIVARTPKMIPLIVPGAQGFPSTRREKSDVEIETFMLALMLNNL